MGIIHIRCYSYQYSTVIPDLVYQTTKRLLSPSEKKTFILLLKLQYIDEVIDSLSLLSPKISEG